MGKAGIAVVRLSGPSAAAVAALLTGSDVLRDRVARLRQLHHPDDGRHLDSGLVLAFPGPASFTGEDVVEFHVHGGRAVVEAVLDAVHATGQARAAEAGEFTRRAFDAGKLDLTAVEGLADLIDAETEAQRQQALGQYGGALGELYASWRERLIGLLAHLEAGIDFVEEADVPAAVTAAVRPQIAELMEEMAQHLDDGRRGEILRSGLSIAIIGPPNAGKSSVLNWLAGRDAAIVATTAGTTRDVIEVRLDLGGYPVILSDTAGLRPDSAADDIEIEGMRRARDAAAAADMRLYVIDGVQFDTLGLPGPDEYELLLVNKSDLDEWTLPGNAIEEVTYGVSARTGAGFGGVLQAISQYVEKMAPERVTPVLTRTRHREAIQGALAALEQGQTAEEIELAAEDLRRASLVLGRVVGAVDVEDLLDVIFHDFCIGK